MAKRRPTAASGEKGNLPDGYSWGRDILLESMDRGRIAVSSEGVPHAYLGYLELDAHSDAFLYRMSVGGETLETRKSYQFLQLCAGGLHLSNFLHDDTPYIVLPNRRLLLPHSARNWFGVVTDQEELDATLTRTLFGATYEELDEFIDAFWSAIRYPMEHSYYRKPARITFSKSGDNSCDLSGFHIPKEFPFIAFSDTQYFGGHISLGGFYRHLAFLCHCRQCGDGKIEGEAFFKRLVESGAKPEIIVQLREAAFAGLGASVGDPTGTLLQYRAAANRRTHFP